VYEGVRRKETAMEDKMKSIKKMITAVFALFMAFTLTACTMAEEKHPVTGGWSETEDGAITEDIRDMFDKATESIIGVDYVPVEVIGTQIVNGTNYRILCEAKTVTPTAETRYVIMTIYQKLNGEAEVLEITDTEAPAASLGGSLTSHK
jgi:uncharacterized lipoprotein YehR (DUF1307 family)